MVFHTKHRQFIFLRILGFYLNYELCIEIDHKQRYSNTEASYRSFSNRPKAAIVSP